MKVRRWRDGRGDAGRGGGQGSTNEPGVEGPRITNTRANVMVEFQIDGMTFELNTGNEIEPDHDESILAAVTTVLDLLDFSPDATAQMLDRW